jgi:hypothetical protein
LDPSARSRREDHEDERRTHALAHKPQHAVDLEAGAIVGVTVQEAVTCHQLSARLFSRRARLSIATTSVAQTGVRELAFANTGC